MNSSNKRRVSAEGLVYKMERPVNAMRTLGTITNEGYSCVIREDDQLRVFFMADGDIDADGANGQNGGPPA
jgi:hypothetical protein